MSLQVVRSPSCIEVFLAELQDETYALHKQHSEAESLDAERGSSAHNVAFPRMVGRHLFSGIFLLPPSALPSSPPFLSSEAKKKKMIVSKSL